MRRSEVYVIDTQTLLWFFTADAKLSPRVKDLLLVAERGEFEIVIPVVVMAEALAVIEKGRSPLTIDDLLTRVQGVPSFNVAAFDMDVFQEMLSLPKELELHDRAIAATARLFGARVLTRDRALTQVVEAMW